MNNIKLMMKGFIVGLGKIIPGVSGGMLAMVLGIYEDAISAVVHFFKDVKKNLIFIGMLGIGVMSAIVGMSGIIRTALEQYYLPTMLLFVGLMLGGFASLKREVKGTNYTSYWIYLLFPFLFMMFFHYMKGSNSFIFDDSIGSMFLLFIFGMIDAVTMIVPGISGTAILMLLGCYTMLLETIQNLFQISMLTTTLKVLLPFGSGILIGAIITVKIVSHLLEKHSVSFHYMIISFFLSSVMLLFLQTLKQNYSLETIIVGVVTFLVGYFISKLLDSHYN